MGLSSQSIEERASFEFIRYGNVWEDADVLCEALAPVARGRRLLSIASAGDNALALLTLDPKEIVAADLSFSQLACLELRIVAFQKLSYDGLLKFMGVTPDPGRIETYQKLRKQLSPKARAKWDQHPEAISFGIIHAGKFEKFLSRYQGLLRSWVHATPVIEELLRAKPRAKRVQFYEKVWNTRAWRLLNRLAFSRRILGLLGRDKEFFRHAKRDVTTGPRERLARALTELPTAGNPYLRYHLTGNYSPKALPLYLRPEHHLAIRRRIGRIKLFLGAVEKAPGKFSGFNLSNIFEYMDSEGHVRTYHRLLAKALPGSRLAYWNLHVSRRCPADGARQLKKLAARLHARDKSWPYKAFCVDEQINQ